MPDSADEDERKLRKYRVVIGVLPRQYEFLKREAERTGMSVSELARRIIDKYIEDGNKP